MIRQIQKICPFYSNMKNFTLENGIYKSYNVNRKQNVIIKQKKSKSIIKSTFNHWLCSENNIKVPDFNSTTKINTNLYIIEYAYIEGDDLLNYLHKNTVTEDIAYSILVKIYYNIQQIQNIGYVHLDLKPENILYTKTNDIVLLDLENMSPILSEYSKISNGMLFTKNYMSPEVLKGNFHYNTDLWNLGLIGFILFLHYNPIQDNCVKINNIHNFCYNELIKKGTNKSYCSLIYNLLQPDAEKRKWTN